jgi:hypothetical protein
MHKVDTLVYRASCISNNALRQKKRFNTNCLKCGCPCVRTVFDTLSMSTGGRHSDGTPILIFFLWVRDSKYGLRTPLFFFLFLFIIKFSWYTRGPRITVQHAIEMKYTNDVPRAISRGNFIIYFERYQTLPYLNHSHWHFSVLFPVRQPN